MTTFITIDRHTLQKKIFKFGHKALIEANKLESAYVIRRIGTFSEIIYRKGK